MADHIIARLRRTSSIKISRQQSYVVNIKDTTCQAPTQRQYCDLSLKGRLWNLEKIQEAKIKELYSAMPAYCPAQTNLFLCFTLLSETNLHWTIPISMSLFMPLLHFGRSIHPLLLCWVNYYWSFKVLFKSQASCKAFLDIFILCWLLLKLNPLELP